MFILSVKRTGSLFQGNGTHTMVQYKLDPIISILQTVFSRTHLDQHSKHQKPLATSAFERFEWRQFQVLILLRPSSKDWRRKVFVSHDTLQQDLVTSPEHGRLLFCHSQNLVGARLMTWRVGV